jgi:hypothetical protein
MPNLFLPRATVHTWSEQIGDQAAEQQSALSRLLHDQRRLSKFIDENRQSMDPPTASVSLYLVGVVIRLYDMAGGRLRTGTWAQIRDASLRIEGALPDLLPLDDAFPERVRKILWRSQPHILDEALMALFAPREKRESEANLSAEESAKVFFLLWVANEVLDSNWSPPREFAGDADYTYVHIEPKAETPREAAPS